MARKKKKAGTLIILLVVLILMILLYFLVVNKNKEEVKTEDTISLSTIESDQVTEISYTMNGTTLTYRKSDDTWIDESDTKAPINQDNITNMLSEISSLTAEKMILEDAKDLSEYGLDKPALTINVTCDDETTFEFCIGDSLVVGSGYYAKLSDSNTVYAVEEGIYSAFNYTQTQMLAIEEFPTITTTNITSINVNKNGRDVFKADYDQSASDAGEYYAWKISKPYSTVQKGDPSQFDTYLGSYGSVTLSECVDYNSSDLSKYGLDKPSATIDLSYYTETTAESSTTDDSSTTDESNDSTSDTSDTTSASEDDTQEEQTIRTDYKLTLLVGDQNDDGEYYVQVIADGREYENAVYTIDSSTIETMLDITAYDFVYNVVAQIDIASLDTLTVKADGKTYELTVAPNPDKETEVKEDEETAKDTDTTEDADSTDDTDSTEDSEEVPEYLYYYNGSEVEETAFKELYEDITGITTTGNIKKEVSDTTPVYEFTFTRNSDEFEELHVTYLPYDGVNFYRVSINGEENFLVEKTAVDKVVKSISGFSSK
ncbi:DUF4340 domain-containing protein [Anaerosporobacter sp.]